jgi:hypothetical protein
LTADSLTLSLTLPRCVSIQVDGASLAAWYDTQADKYLAVCPKCRRLVAFDTLQALRLSLALGDRRCCQGCRAKITFEHDPGLISVFVDFWSRSGAWPESPSWFDAIPPYQLNRWAREIAIGLEAATAPLAYAESRWPKAEVRVQNLN